MSSSTKPPKDNKDSNNFTANSDTQYTKEEEFLK